MDSRMLCQHQREGTAARKEIGNTTRAFRDFEYSLPKNCFSLARRLKKRTLRQPYLGVADANCRVGKMNRQFSVDEDPGNSLCASPLRQNRRMVGEISRGQSQRQVETGIGFGNVNFRLRLRPQ